MSSVTSLWAREYRLHWTNSWRVLRARDELLDKYKPRVFSVEDDRLTMRYGRSADLYLNSLGLHLRIFADEDRAATHKVLADSFQAVQPQEIRHLSASYATVTPLAFDYDTARNIAGSAFLAMPMHEKLQDFAIHLDRTFDEKTSVQTKVGVVDSEELLERVAETVATDASFLKSRTPAWMKVRMPQCALFYASKYECKDAKLSTVSNVLQSLKSWEDDLLESASATASLIPVNDGDRSI